ncbi:hypothetical protein CHS0354_013139 [Potamilus streckersoni]|uniref:tRNA-5-taurinomethyluridine 2-sulfurtransferase n=1 Tax=Potamilus streckersoni TaxID=2493646 RepID=A0AAE0S6R4_9BIVA|nr:hypothetical protein CHS0354_013139 [Potamilus streckersoni]
MSGGVDSSVAAALLKSQGYRVFGLMLRMWTAEEGENRCCSLSSINDAREVADILGITPNPCIYCNRNIRFGHLLKEAISLGADYLATGHYVRLNRREDGFYQLRRGIDTHKDQSYMLYRLNQQQLAQALFPVGEYTKDDIRQKARKFGLPVSSKHDSQDLCFLGDNTQKEFLSKYVPETQKPGGIKLKTGEIIGRHDGLAYYTIGQRKGINLSWHEPLYVTDKDTATNMLTVGPVQDTFAGEITGRLTCYTLAHEPPPSAVEVQIRYKDKIIPAQLTPADNYGIKLTFGEAVRDATPGQSAVFYHGDTLLGGAIIDRVIRN